MAALLNKSGILRDAFETNPWSAMLAADFPFLCRHSRGSGNPFCSSFDTNSIERRNWIPASAGMTSQDISAL
jgi:hypothetical protein